MPNQQVEQALVVQAQNGVNMASGTATTAPSMAITAPSTAPSTAPLQVAGPSPMEPIVVQLGQDTPSVIQGARPDVGIEQTTQSTQRYGTLPYIPGPQYTAPLPQYTAPTAPLPYAASLPCILLCLLLCQQGLQYQWVIMVRAALLPLCPTLIGCLRESSCYNYSSSRKGSNMLLGELAKPKLSLNLSPKCLLRGQFRLKAMLIFQRGQPVLQC